VKVFVDTNILVYAHDRGAGDKHSRALSLVETLWREAKGLISTQVLQEFYVNIRRKALRPVSHAEAKAVVTAYLAWNPIVNDGTAVLDAIDIETRFKLSFWDALIVVAAQRSGASVIYSEDLQHGQQFGAVRAENPLRVS
jgi:predicted nucleic acid-binding protein